MTEAEAIAKRIESFGAGKAFTAADFSDVAGRRNAANGIATLNWTISGGTNLPF